MASAFKNYSVKKNQVQWDDAMKFKEDNHASLNYDKHGRFKKNKLT